MNNKIFNLLTNNKDIIGLILSYYISIWNLLLDNNDITLKFELFLNKSNLNFKKTFFETNYIYNNINTYYNDYTPLTYCAKYNLKDELIYLLNYHKISIINNQDNYECSPLVHAIQNNNTDIIKILLSYKNLEINNLILFINYNINFECFKLLITNNFIINKIYKMMTPLIFYTLHGKYNYIEELLKIDSINYNYMCYGYNALMMACSHTYKYYLNETNIISNYYTCIEILLYYIVDIKKDYNFINEQTDFGKTALMLAVEINDIYISKLLLSYNADLTITNSSNETAIDIAKSNNYMELYNLLTNYS
jgi:hypothetical protein